MHLKKEKKKKETLPKGYDSIKVFATPVEKLLKSGLIFPSWLALSYQRGVGGKDDTFLHTSIVLWRDFAIFELKNRKV